MEGQQNGVKQEVGSIRNEGCGGSGVCARRRVGADRPGIWSFPCRLRKSAYALMNF